MARRKGMEPMHDDHVNVTPLIDVIMCLIIFFMLVGNFAKAQANDQVTIPKATDGHQMEDQQGRLMINLVPQGRGDLPAGTAAPAPKPDDVITDNPNAEPDVFINGQKMAMNELRIFLRTQKRDKPNLKVILRADQSVSYMWIAPILVACAQADIKSVNFSTRTK